MWPNYPPGSEPAKCPVFVHNEIHIAAPPDAVWKKLVRPRQWPEWFPGAKNVDAPDADLAKGTKVAWNMLGARIRVQIEACEPGRVLEWRGGAAGVDAYHGWLLEPAGNGTRVVTDETEKGPLPWVLRWYLRGALHRAHQEWLECLARASAG